MSPPSRRKPSASPKRTTARTAGGPAAESRRRAVRKLTTRGAPPARFSARKLEAIEAPPALADWTRATYRNADHVGSALRRAGGKYLLSARPDTVDFRDRMYVTTLVEVPREKPVEDYMALRLPVLDQGREGACTGFGLAAMVHFLLKTRKLSGSESERRRERVFNAVPVSPHMLYRMARRYDEWAGEDDDGSSARGAMKGWHRHGVCSLEHWPAAGAGTSDTLFTDARAVDALSRPLGGYFRVNHQDIVAMHAAIAEVGILYATAWVHQGWDKVKADGRIPFDPEWGQEGGHAFAIVAYDRDGFWIQNSWGPGWGRRGFCHIGYDDWLKHGTDVWVGRLGAPVGLATRTTAAAAASAAMASGAKTPIAIAELRPHVVSVGNDGALRTSGTLGTDAAAVDAIFRADFPRITAGWKKPRLLLYAHGGLVQEDGALQRVQDYRKALVEAQVYPLAFVWKTDYWTTLKNALEDAQRKRKPEGLLDKTRDFLLNRLDDALEPIARFGTGKLEWDEMKENAEFATTKPHGAARLVAHYVAQLAAAGVEIHVAGHSAGSIFMGPLTRLLATRGAIDSGPLLGEAGLGVPLKTVTMWAPACTIDLWDECYRPCVDSGAIGQFALFTLTDKAEQDDHCARVYNKSLLYLVSHAFEKHLRNPLVPIGKDEEDPARLRAAGVGILGMEWWLRRDRRTKRYFQELDGSATDPAAESRAVWLRSPNTAPQGSRNATASSAHGDFDDDAATVKATLARILGRKNLSDEVKVEFRRSEASNRDRREAIMR